MNYKIIADEDTLNEFIEWLPDCDENEQFYMALFARKKYVPTLPWVKSDKGQMARRTAQKDRIIQKIRQLECAFGSYELDDNPVPQEALACYISVNPRDLWQATLRSISKLAKVLECNGKNSNPHQEVMSEIQRTPGNRKYVSFDIDNKDDKTLEQCIEYCDAKCDVIETRGGYHLHVHKDKIPMINDQKNWYKNIMQHADQSGDIMSPIVGCYQGMHLVKFVFRYDERL
jgi:hypothetical protein